tara:strand:- start:335 stop:538 length:204 start_codon:yes stop_codon:yes gene_type:complete
MCLGGGGGYDYTEPKREPWVSDYVAGPDTVNNKLVSQGGDYSQSATKDLAPKKGTLKVQSSKNTGLY